MKILIDHPYIPSIHPYIDHLYQFISSEVVTISSPHPMLSYPMLFDRQERLLGNGGLDIRGAMLCVAYRSVCL